MPIALLAIVSLTLLGLISTKRLDETLLPIDLDPSASAGKPGERTREIGPADNPTGTWVGWVEPQVIAP